MAVHVPKKEPFLDAKGYVSERWLRFFDNLNEALDTKKLDDLATPDDNTDLNATAARHGLLPKLSGNGAQSLRGDGTWA